MPMYCLYVVGLYASLYKPTSNLRLVCVVTKIKTSHINLYYDDQVFKMIINFDMQI